MSSTKRGPPRPTASAALAANLADLNRALEALAAAPLPLLPATDEELTRAFGERLVVLLQKTKDLSAVLREPSRKSRPLLAPKDVRVVEGQDHPVYRLHVGPANTALFEALAELSGEKEAAENAHLGRVVDAFAEELDQVRQTENLGPAKLELLIDTLRASAAFFA